MNTAHENDAVAAAPTFREEQGLTGSKDGKGIGDLADERTLDAWAREYLGADRLPGLATAFRYGARAEGRHAGQSFIEAEASIRSEWSSERDRAPWDAVRDAVWAGFDRARDRRV